MSLTFDCWRRHFSGEEKLHASTERTEISFAVQNLESMFHLWQKFCSKTAHRLPRSSAAVLLRPSCELLSAFVQLTRNPLCSDFSLLQCLNHDSENWSSWHVCFMRNFFTWFASIFFQHGADVTTVVVCFCYGRPLLGSSLMLTRPSGKPDAHRDTVLRFTTLSP